MRRFITLRNNEYRLEQLITPDGISKIPWNYYPSFVNCTAVQMGHNLF